MPYQTNQRYAESGHTGGRGRMIDRSISFLGGAGLGAILMYLFDPDSGYDRRCQAKDAAVHAAHGAGETLGQAWHSIAESAGNLAHRAGETGVGLASGASQIGESAREYGRSFFGTARQFGRRASSRGQDMASRAGAYLPRVSFGRRPEPARRHGIGTDVLLAAGCLAVGIGAMYLFDPQRGRSRRAVIRDKFGRVVRQSGEAAYDTGRYLSDYARGVAAETRGRFSREQVTDEQLCARVRSELGRVVSHPRAIEITACEGNVTVSGPVLESEADTLLAAISSVRGVRHVDDRLQRHASAGNIPDLQGTPSQQSS